MHFDADQLQSRLSDFVALLQETINGGASLGFLPPFGADEAEVYWHQVKRGIAEADVLLFCVLDEGEIIATAQLQPSTRANARHRAEVTRADGRSQSPPPEYRLAVNDAPRAQSGAAWLDYPYA